MLKHIVFVSVISLVRCRAAIGLEAMSPYLLTAEKSNCKFSTHLCKPSSLSLVKTVINITSITGCQNMCAKEKSPKCKFVTLTNFRNITSCHLLTNCDDKVLTLCLSSSSNTLHIVLTLNIYWCPPCRAWNEGYPKGWHRRHYKDTIHYAKRVLTPQ